MRYQGGKHFEGPHFARILTDLQRGRPYWEPFCGGCGVMQHMTGQRIGSDVLPDVILMWQQLQKGWQPPTRVTREEWWESRRSKPSARRGFIGFGCSYGAMFFRSYAPGEDKWASSAARSALKKVKKLLDVEFFCADYKNVETPDGVLIYCDPPYAGTFGYKGTNFNHDHFWQWVRDTSKRNTVIVSSFEAPKDFRVIFEYETATTAGNYSHLEPRKVTERLFQLRNFK